MAATKYAKHVGGRQRKAGTLDRREYQVRARELALRGQELPHAKLLDLDVVGIRSAVRQRDALRQHIANNLSNEALARIYGVHVRSIEKIISRETWSHIA